MANYNVDIQLQVQGLKKVQDLNKTVEKLNQETKNLQGRLTKGNPFNAAGATKLNKALQDGINKTQTLSKRNKDAADRQARNIKNLINLRKELRRVELDNTIRRQKAAAQEAARSKKQRGAGLQSAALGVGFPLLFGGGAGSVLGGGLGSVGGFGGQIIGSAIGQQIDQFAQKTAELGVALSAAGLDVTAVTAAAGELGSEAERVINELNEVAGAEEAAAVAADLLANKIGEDGVRALEEFGAAGQELGAAVSELNTEFMVLAATLLGPVVKGIAGLVQRANLASQTSTMLREGGPEAARIRAARRASMEQGGSADDATVAGQAEAAKILEERRQKILSTARDTSLENSKALQIAQKESEILELNGDLTDESVYLRKQELIELETKAKLSKENLTDLEKELIGQERINQLKGLENQRTRELENQGKKDQKEAEAFERKLQQNLKKRRQLQANLLAEDSKRQEIENKVTEATEGRAAAIQRELADMQAAYTADAQRIILTTESRDLAQEKVNTLAKEYELKQLLLRQEYTELQLQKDLLAIKQEQTLAGISTNLNRQIEDANLRSTGNSMEDEQLELRISQIRRQEDARRALTEQIERQEAAILRYSESGNATGVIKAQQEVEFLQRQIVLHDQLLPQLDAAEQAQLRFNQALQAAQPFADAFTSGLFNGLMGVIDGTQTAQEAFAGFLNSIADMLMQTAQQMITQYLALAVARTFAMGGGPVSSGVNTSFMGGGFNPLSFVLGPFSGFGKALGGSVSGNQPYLVGERGPELFVPGAQGNIVPNNAMGGVNVGTINISVENTGEQLSPQAQKQLAGQVKGIVLGTLANERRSGGML